MKIQFWSIGKKHERYVSDGITMFTKRLQHYFPIQWQIIPTPKNSGTLNPEELKSKEGDQILKLVQKDDYLVLLDETGKQLQSEGLAQLIQSVANASNKNLIFLIGGAYGVDTNVKKRANTVWAL